MEDAFAAVGVLTADGNGNITSGQQDVNDAFSGVLQQVAISNGTYSVGVDGRGQATLNFANGAPSANFNFVLLSTSKARVVELSNFELSSGVLEKQVPAAISALTGPAYVLRMDGSSNNTLPDLPRRLAHRNRHWPVSFGRSRRKLQRDLHPDDCRLQRKFQL